MASSPSIFPTNNKFVSKNGMVVIKFVAPRVWFGELRKFAPLGVNILKLIKSAKGNDGVVFIYFISAFFI